MFSPDDYGARQTLIGNDGATLEPLPAESLTYVSNRDGHDGEFYRSIRENTPEQCFSNFADYAGPLTETILLGNLAVWAASEPDVWGETIEWDARNLSVTNLASLKTPGVGGLVKPVYRGNHRLD